MRELKMVKAKKTVMYNEKMVEKKEEIIPLIFPENFKMKKK